MAETIRIEIPIEAVDETAPGLHSAMQGMQKLEQAYKSAGQSAKKADREVSQFDRRAQKTEKSLAGWAKEKYEILLEAKEKITPILSTLGNGLRGFAGKTWSVTMRAVDLITSPVRGIINLLKNPIFQVGAVLGVSIGLKDTIDTYKDFEAAMSQVRAISGATGSEVTKLTEKAKEMGATTKFTAKESADAFNYMAMAGWKTDDMLGGIEGILSLAAASGEDLATTSDIVTDALTAFGMKASDAGRFSDVLAVASSNANTNVSMMGETFKYVGAASGALGYTIEDVALGIGLMANAGIKASQAGTELNSIFTRLATDTNGSRAAIEELGISFYKSDGNARAYRDVLDDMREATKDMTREQKMNFANTVAGQRAQAGLLAMLNASEKDYRKLTDSIEECDGAAANMSETMLDNLQGSITLLQSAADGVKISFGERLSPYVRGLADWLTAQMPAIEQGLGEFMDWAEVKIGRMQNKFKEVAGTKEWQDADFFGKAKIAWDEFIAEPFSGWWNSTGKAKFAGFAQDIGSGIGAGLKTGIMTLLGIDVGETLDEGASIGASFAKGFSEGFDFNAISEKLWQGFKNLLSNAGKLLPGGEPAGLSSVMSAVLLSKIARPLIGMGRGAASLGKGLFGTNPATGTSLMGSFMGSAAAGTGLLGFGANTAISLGAGNLAGGASLGVGALSAMGLGAVAGGAAGGATLISGAVDAYKAFRSADKEESKAYGESAAWKAGGVAAGAAAGAALGSVIPGLGTAVGALVGSGIGGIAGWIKGNKVKEEYQENVEEMQKEAEKAQKVFEATGLSIEDVRFRNEALTQAMNDSEVSAEQFARMFQEECASVAKKAFGDMHLSLEEIKSLAQTITFGKMAKSIERFRTAASQTEKSLSALEQSMSALDKWNWQASLGLKLKKDERESYRESVDSFIESAQSYIDNNHYEATVALKLIGGSKVDTSVVDGIYGEIGAQLQGAGAELQRVMDEALEDGIISSTDRIKVNLGGMEFELNEDYAIARAQEQVDNIAKKLSEAKNETTLDAMELRYSVRYSGAGMDMESYAQMQEELKAYADEKAQTIEEAYVSASIPLKLKLQEGGLSNEEAQAIQDQLHELDEQFKGQMEDADLEVRLFNLNTLADAWGDQLEGILPEIEGTTAEKLGKAMENAIISNPDVASWTTEEVKEWFGLDELAASEGEAFADIYEQIKQTASAIPEGTKETILQDFKEQMPSTQEIKDAIGWDGMDLGGVNGILESVAGPEAFGKTFEEFYGSGLGQAKEGYAHALQTAISESWSEALAGAVVERLDAAAWDTQDIIGWLGIDGLGLGTEAQEELAGLLKSALSVPEGSKDEILQAIKEQMPTAEEIEGLIDWEAMDFKGWDALMEGITGSATAGGQEGYFGDYLGQMKEAALSALQNAMSGSSETLGKFMEQYMAEAADGFDFGSIMEQYGPISDECYSQMVSEWQEAGTAYGNALNDGASASLRSGSPALRSGMQAALDAATAAPLTVSPMVNVNPKYSVSSSYFPLPGLGAASPAAGGGKARGHAAGGYVSGGPQLSWLAEEGYGEFVIPTNPSRRGRALELYEQAGEALGVSAHAAGGYAGPPILNGTAAGYESFSDVNRNAPIAYNEGTAQAHGPVPAESGSAFRNGPVQVQVSVAPEFVIHGSDGQNEEGIMQAVRKHMKEIADELGGEIAVLLEEVFSNMPLKEA